MAKASYPSGMKGVPPTPLRWRSEKQLWLLWRRTSFPYASPGLVSRSVPSALHFMPTPFTEQQPEAQGEASLAEGCPGVRDWLGSERWSPYPGRACTIASGT